ncbi:MAG TPA: Crp/Fnr family transcriptional regulator [Casimicrobiaceae bacterium]
MTLSLEPVDLLLGQHLHDPGSAQEHFYFPGTSIVSLVGVLRNGDATELSLVGCEGGVGIGLILGGETTLTRATVQNAGTALRWKAATLKRELKRGGVVQRMLLRYIQAMWTQTAQSALCNRHHTLQQQLCRWLLLSLDRVDSNVLRMTQQLIADMIGVRREGVALAAKKLEIVGWISYRRGVIVVLNRAALEANSCECYDAVNAEYRRLIGWPKAHRKPRAAALSPMWTEM